MPETNPNPKNPKPFWILCKLTVPAEEGHQERVHEGDSNLGYAFVDESFSYSCTIGQQESGVMADQ